MIRSKKDCARANDNDQFVQNMRCRQIQVIYQLRSGWSRGVSRNVSEPDRYFKMDVDQGSAAVQTNYGILLNQGEGVSRNLSEAGHTSRWM